MSVSTNVLRIRTMGLRLVVMMFALYGFLQPSTALSQGVYDCDYGYGNISVSSPSAGQQYTRGGQMSISWRLSYPSPYNDYWIQIHYSTNSGSTWNLIVDNVDRNSTQYTWSIPTSVTFNNTWRIRVREIPNDNDGWWCRWNYDGITGNFTMLKGCFSPTFSQQPTSRTACTGASTSWTVVTDGEFPTYQWLKDGVAIQGATAQTYTVNPVTVASAGVYNCIVRDQCGASATSAGAVLTVIESPSITQQPPALIAACENAEIRIMVRAAGSGRLFQWRFNGVNIALNGRDSVYIIGNASLASNGLYDCVVSGTCTPAVTSSQCTVSVVARPRLTTEPQDMAFCPGSSGSLTTVASGSALVYQWLRNGQEVPGANGASLNFTNYQSSSDGLYQVRVTTNVPNPNNCQTTVFSREVRVSSYKNPTITTQPNPTADICIGQPFTLSSDAQGFELGYQWYRDTVAIPGAVQSSYEVTRGAASNSGSYTVRVTGRCGLITTSTPSVVSVLTTPVVSVQPQSKNLTVGDRLMLEFSASDIRTIQWTKNNAPIQGATSTTFEINNVTLQDAGSYNAIVRNSCGGAVTNYAVVRVKDPSLDLPELTLSQNSLDFGEIPIGYDRSQVVSGLIRNTGSAPMQVQSIIASGNGFSIANAPTTPFTLAPNESADVAISALPGSIGPAGGQVTVTTNAPAPTGTVALLATAVLRYSHPQSVSFEDTEENTTRQSCIMIVNTSSMEITIDNAALTGANGGEFSVDAAGPVVIAAGADAEVCITFAPTTSGDKVAALTVTSANGGNSSMAITGRGTPTVSVDEQLALNGAAVYPNPSSGDVYIQLAAVSGTTTIEIRDVAGKLITSFNGVDVKYRWNGRDSANALVPSGMYIVNIRNSNGITSLPFSVVR